MKTSMVRSRRVFAVAFVMVTGAFGLGAHAAQADHSDDVGMSFTFLAAGFTQDLYATHLPFAVGVAFAPDGDPVVGLGDWFRIDSQGDEPNAHGDELHPVTPLGHQSDWVGLVNHPNGFIYSNNGAGVRKHNPETGVPVAGPFGPGGNTLGIAVDPKNDNLVYVDSSGGISFVDPDFTTSGSFSTATVGQSIDGIYFDPTGEFLFLANFSTGGVTVLRHDGTLVRNIPVSGGPDGIAFHAESPKFLVTVNNDGTMHRLDFAGDDYTLVPTDSIFASGGFRGDLANVGPDGCLYLSQGGTRFEDGDTNGEGSLVRICSGFAPAPGAGTEGPPGDATCSDSIDNDGDTNVDQQDADCQTAEGPVGDATCSDTIDNDGDGDVDAADSDCQGGPPPPHECSAPGAIVGTSGNDVLTGTPGDDLICGLAGNDRISGLGGNDVIIAGDGDDRVHGGEGDDDIRGRRGDDRLNGDEGEDTIHAGYGNDRIDGGSENDHIDGGPGDDYIAARGGDDYANGDAGNDRVNGGRGNDRLFGSSGDDIIEGTGGADQMHGGADNDNLLAFDRHQDTVRCESGADSADVDAVDDVSGCEATTVH